MNDFKVILFQNYKAQEGACEEFWKGFVEEYNNQAHLMGEDKNFQQHNEANDLGYNGNFQSGNFNFVWQKFFKDKLVRITNDNEPYKAIEHIELHNTTDTILVLDWITFTSIELNFLDYCFTIFKGKILIDDSFESHPLRNDVMAYHLKHNLKYNTDKIGFFTNCPRLDGVVKTGNLYKDDWLHLTMLTEFLDPVAQKFPTTLQPIDKKELKDYDNKKHLVLMLNGHTTKQRARQLASLWFYDLLDSKVRYSVCDKGASHILGFHEQLKCYNIRNKQFAQRIFDKLIPKRLENDLDSGRERDMFVQTEWWASCFYNLNVDTNQNYWKDYSTFHDGSKYYVNVSEKWLKQILYYTPGINTNEYTRLEEHILDMGFKSYDFIDKGYDIDEDKCRTADFIACRISELEKPSRSEWNAMMEIAEYNYNHLFNEHLPRLEQSFLNCIEQLLEQ
jgi:hypothetical protein